ncbi:MULTISPECIES: glycosyltransferase [Clostridium]|uniref:Glycosyltransferase involved in cell wall biosynthesis n=4 Tax=Clostridium beijerinckii TaxID=1520 RepID=A0A9Q5D3K8_CLOBE|nr:MULTISPECIES: glycosyltransferase [Clostridium]AQS07573.1 glycosyl transferases group 1 [Clostridium beijerinckii]MBA2884199.1 glycosyltransferase involved in cell wall biosynthesis [Clostridium beijerinckii]MBA2898268.1 glycosyltransferase involved in cell wall biosynthesis [Clostridium beijerinckii]MBA2908947.1 glycosyltransferase involved in cell wall biosynthesis [Clostridium beijerinckii]MBA9012790.1 glycosyltransferase involved in cell wall biosynthesis [Clostridium beijerinckii]
MKDNLGNITKQSKEKLSDTKNLKEDISCVVKDKMKLVFFVRLGLDSFLGDIIEGLSQEYEIKKIIATEYKQIEDGMQWADICWFEWCDELIAYGSKLELAREKKVICRLHSYEAFTDYINNVTWNSIDKLIVVGAHIKDFIVQNFNIDEKIISVIPNGIDEKKWTYKERENGFNIAYVGYINYKKGPMLLLHTFKAIYDEDNRYKLYIAGVFQDNRDVLYYNQMVRELGLENNVIYEGWQNDLDKWLEDKNAILCTSVLESQNISVMQTMCKGIKPIIHNFVGARVIYPYQYVWNTITEAVEMISDKNYTSKVYRAFIKERYSLNDQLIKIKDLLISLSEKGSKENLNYINPDHLRKSSDQVDLMKTKFRVNSDDMTNTEALFDYLLSINDEESYMKYLSEWFIRSKYELTFKFNYYYGNMYRRFTSYSRFKYMQENVYEEMDKIGGKILDENYLTYFNNKKISLKENKRKILFILNGLDIHQSVTQFFINYLESSKNIKYRYSVLSLLNKNEFNNSKESIDYFNKLNVNLFVPISNCIEDKIKEFYTYISEGNFDYVVYQSLYFAPIGILLYPLLKKVCKIIGKIQFQQPEDYFDKKLDFCYTYIKKDNCCENIFELISPINTELVDKNLDIRTLFNIDRKKKVVISIGRSIKYKNNEFWNFAIKLINEIDDICLVVFGGNYSEFEQYVPNKLIQECNVIFAGFNLEASSYLKSCDFYLNSYPGGGYSLEEAYYAELPIITFYKEENNEAFDVMNASYMAPAYLYNNAKTIFPKTGDFDKLLSYSKKLIQDNSFRNTVKMNRKIESNNFKFEYFVKEFEKYMDNIANNNGRNNK